MVLWQYYNVNNVNSAVYTFLWNHHNRETEQFDPLYIGLFYCHMLDESICKCRGNLVYFVTIILFRMAKPVSKLCWPWSDIMWRLIWVCTLCLWPFYGFPGNYGLSNNISKLEIIFLLKKEFTSCLKQFLMICKPAGRYFCNLFPETNYSQRADNHVTWFGLFCTCIRTGRLRELFTISLILIKFSCGEVHIPCLCNQQRVMKCLC